MHKACRFRNKNLIDLLMRNGIGDLSKRNNLGDLPLEMPHNDILNDDDIKQVIERYHEEYDEYIVLKKEPDYMFVVNLEREEVLLD